MYFRAFLNIGHNEDASEKILVAKGILVFNFELFVDGLPCGAG
jgi:hypothetical protein